MKRNRLQFEKSPYLLQHAANPVDWRPWGEEAFEAARREDLPVFLSVGYSTCHWCHVMERECFEDGEVAALLNRHFVCVKVDREERPDIDHVYMNVTQAMTGSGGWPMTIFMTPDKKPFFAGTYFPKHDHMGRPGMLRLVPALGKIWKEERSRALETARQVVQALGQRLPRAGVSEYGPQTLDLAFASLRASYDKERGGFGAGNKFPTPHNLTFLLRHHKRTGNPAALEMAEATLRAMRQGGIYDHVGFGIHRYATDPDWLLPHFEKMLYDQALTANACLEAFQATGKEEYARTAREIFAYVLRDMTSPEGGFYSAEDADSEGEEGKFYVWTPQETVKVLGAKAGNLVNSVYNIAEGGNFFEQATGKRTGDSILHLKEPLEAVARRLDMKTQDLEKQLDQDLEKLFAHRRKRIPPHKDDKVLTDWNGLMIAALAKGARVLDQPECASAAKKAAGFILSALTGPTGRLLKRHRDGEAALTGLLDDYAFMVWGLLELYEATFEVKWLEKALALNQDMLDHFWDKEQGGLFLTPDDGEQLFMRGKEAFDGAMPSGNSVAAVNLLRLAGVTGDENLRQKARDILDAFSDRLARQPGACTHLLGALDFLLGPSHEIVIAGKPGAGDVRGMVRALERRFDPSRVLVFRPDSLENPAPPEITRLAPHTLAQTSKDGKATAYVCKNSACRQPVTDIAAVLDILDGKA